MFKDYGKVKETLLRQVELLAEASEKAARNYEDYKLRELSAALVQVVECLGYWDNLLEIQRSRPSGGEAGTLPPVSMTTTR